MRIVRWFSLAVGVLMCLQWGVTLATGGAPEVRTEPIRLGFHLAAEAATAAVLILAALAGFRGKTWARDLNLVGLGLLGYTVVVSPGYFAERGQAAPVIMFAFLLVCTVVCVMVAARSQRG